MADRRLLEQMVDMAAKKFGVDRNVMRSFIEIESGWRPNTTTGSYKGLFQLSDKEFAKRGGQGDIYNPQSNINAGALQLKALTDEFKGRYGRDPEPWELYMTHQQGAGGYGAHAADPNRPAWQSMASTLEGRQKGEGWAKKAVWGNVPDKAKEQYGSVENMTSQQFLDFWKGRYGRAAGQPAPEITPQGAPAAGSFRAAQEQGMGPPPAVAGSYQEAAQPPAPAEDPAGILSQILGSAFKGQDLSGLFDFKAPSAPKVQMVTAPAPGGRVDMGGIMALAKKANSKFGR